MFNYGFLYIFFNFTSVSRTQVAYEAYRRLLYVRPCLREVDAAVDPFLENLTRLSIENFGITYGPLDPKVREPIRKS